MKKYKLYTYGIIISLGLISLLFGDTTFGMDKPRGTSPCHIKNNGTIDRKKHPEGHRYTCQLNGDNLGQKIVKNKVTGEEEIVGGYCKRESKSINSRETGCPGGFSCHICKCEENSEAIKGRCCLKTNISSNGECCPDGMAVVDGICTVPVISTTGDSSTQVNQNNPVTSNNPEDQNGNNENQNCPPGQLDSQGKCCKQRYYDVQEEKEMCCEGILLNTNVPFIGQCIVYRKANEQQPKAGLVIDEASAFPVLMGGLSKILVSLILLTGFIGILVGGVMISASGGGEEGAKTGRKIIGNVVSAFGLLGASGVILKLINPTFFG